MKRGKKVRSGLGKTFDQWWGRVENDKNREVKAFHDHVANMRTLGLDNILSPDHGFHRPTDWRKAAEARAAEELQKSQNKLRKVKAKKARLIELKRFTPKVANV